MAAQQQFATFYVDHLFFGVKVEEVQEVLRSQEITRVPLAPPVVRGLINLRGQIVTAIDLRRCLELGEGPQGLAPMNVIVRTAEGPVSLLVDDIDNVVEAGEETFERAPDTVRGKAIISGVHKLNGRLMHVLDIANVVSREGE